MISVLVAASYPLIREGLKALIQGANDITLIGEAHNAQQALNRALELDPAVILLDADLLTREGIELIRDVTQSLPDCAVLVVTEVENATFAQNALSNGARGYLPRTLSANEMWQAIRAAAHGLVVIHSSFASALFDGQRVPTNSFDELLEPLTERESQVLQLLARGLANKQIANELDITEHTVKFHIRAILSKLGASNRTEAVSAALQRGLVVL